MKTPPGTFDAGGDFLRLRAGPLRMDLDLASGFLRRVRLEDREILRGIYGAVRDHNWGTVPPRLSGVRHEPHGEGFRVSFDVDCQQPGLHFAWRGTIAGDADGSVRYEFDGVARTSFTRNRIGLCVLHPIRECAGAEALQTRVDGSVVPCRFPDLIEPQVFGQASFRDLSAISYQVMPGLRAEIGFEGDVFEMEDQRNWSDASFKTYGTPLAIPFPVLVQEGTRIRQCVSLRLHREGRTPTRSAVELGTTEDQGIDVHPAPDAGNPPPSLGVCTATHGRDLTQDDISRLRALRLSHLRVDIRADQPGWRERMQHGARQACQIGCSLELAVHLPAEPAGRCSALREQIENSPAPVARVLALRQGEASTSAGTLREVRSLLSGLHIPIGAGSDANFCELNRDHHLGRCKLQDAEFVFWSLNPQVHASDAVSVMETIESLAHQARSARAFACGRPLVVSPLTLKPRFNAVATAAQPTPAGGELPADVDPRQATILAAAWAMGAHAALAGSGVSSLTLFETTGWRGILPAACEPFSHRGAPHGYPVWHGLAELAAASMWTTLPGHDPTRLAALRITCAGGEQRVLLANLRLRPCTVRFHSPAPSFLVSLLDTSVTPLPVVRQATQSGLLILELPPLGVVRLVSH